MGWKLFLTDGLEFTRNIYTPIFEFQYHLTGQNDDDRAYDLLLITKYKKNILNILNLNLNFDL